MQLRDLEILDAVVRFGGLTPAARDLGMTVSAVSRRLTKLEEDLGFAVLHRTPRRVALTESGRLFHARTRELPGVVSAAVQEVQDTRERPTGTLKITAPPDDGGVIWSMLSGFVERHPGVDLQIVHTLENLDFFEHDLDLALRGGSVPDLPELTARQLLDSRILLCASPAYLAERGTPTRVEELAEHDGICMDPWAPNAIRRVDGDRGWVRVTMRNRIRANRLDTARRAALAGLGIAPLLELTCKGDLREGRLVEVLRGALPDSAPFYAVARLPKERSTAASALFTHLTDHSSRMVSS